MKKALPVILIFLALAHVAGIMPIYFYLLDGIKGEMTIALHNETSLQKIVVTGTEYNNPTIFQETNEGEFTFKGQMYDFKNVQKCGIDYIFYGINDDKETNLVGMLKSIFEQGDNHSGRSLPFNNLLKNFSPDFVIPVVKDFMVSLPEKTFHTSVNFITGILAGHLAAFSVPPDFS